MNRLYQQLNQQQSLSAPLSEAAELNRTVQNASNPNVLMNKLIQSNPRLKMAYNMVQQNGGNAKQFFYQLAQQRGIDPNTILNQLR
jgi:hypothetical protein